MIVTTQLIADLAAIEHQRVQEIAKSNADRQRNLLRAEIEHDHFIISKKYRSTLLRVLGLHEYDFLTPAVRLEIAELISIIDKRT